MINDLVECTFVHFVPRNGSNFIKADRATFSLLLYAYAKVLFSMRMTRCCVQQRTMSYKSYVNRNEKRQNRKRMVDVACNHHCNTTVPGL